MMDICAKEEEMGLEQEEGQTKYTCIVCKNRFRGEQLNVRLTV